MRVLRSILTVLFAATLAGCATNNKPVAYSSEKSHALNVVRAAGMKDIQDQVVTQAEYARLSQSSLYDAAWTAVNYNAPAPGVSPNAALALGALNMIFKPTADSSKDLLIAWMPQTMASSPDEAAERLRELVVGAIDKAASDWGYALTDTYLTQRASSGYIASSALVNESKGCTYHPTAEPLTFCSVYLAIKLPQVGSSPVGITPSYPAYTFKVSGINNSHVWLRHPSEAEVDRRAILQKATSHLPQWVFLYLAPEESKEREARTYPALFSSGEQHLFVTPSTP